MKLGRCSLGALVVAVAVLAAGTPAPAADFPVKGKSVTILVPWAAGGNADTFTRLLQPKLEQALGTKVEVVNKPGAGAQVGWTELARAKPDGYTLGHMSQPNLATIVHDPRRQAAFSGKDFQVVSLLVFDPGVIAVKADSPYKTVKDLVEAAKVSPGKIKVTVGGLMGDSHLTGLVFQKVTGTKLAIANFDAGVAPAITALLGGHADATAVALPAVAATVKSGQTRILTVLQSEPNKVVPDVPTLESLGYKGGVMGAYTVLAVPAATPKDTVNLLAAALKKAMEDPELIKKLQDVWQGATYAGPEEASRIWEKADADTKALMAEIQR